MECSIWFDEQCAFASRGDGVWLIENKRRNVEAVSPSRSHASQRGLTAETSVPTFCYILFTPSGGAGTNSDPVWFQQLLVYGSTTGAFIWRQQFQTTIQNSLGFCHMWQLFLRPCPFTTKCSSWMETSQKPDLHLPLPTKGNCCSQANQTPLGPKWLGQFRSDAACCDTLVYRHMLLWQLGTCKGKPRFDASMQALHTFIRVWIPGAADISLGARAACTPVRQRASLSLSTLFFCVSGGGTLHSFVWFVPPWFFLKFFPPRSPELFRNFWGVLPQNHLTCLGALLLSESGFCRASLLFLSSSDLPTQGLTCLGALLLSESAANSLFFCRYPLDFFSIAS